MQQIHALLALILNLDDVSGGQGDSPPLGEVSSGSLDGGTGCK